MAPPAPQDATRPPPSLPHDPPNAGGPLTGRGDIPSTRDAARALAARVLDALGRPRYVDTEAEPVRESEVVYRPGAPRGWIVEIVERPGRDPFRRDVYAVPEAPILKHDPDEIEAVARVLEPVLALALQADAAMLEAARARADRERETALFAEMVRAAESAPESRWTALFTSIAVTHLHDRIAVLQSDLETQAALYEESRAYLRHELSECQAKAAKYRAIAEEAIAAIGESE